MVKPGVTFRRWGATSGSDMWMEPFEIASTPNSRSASQDLRNLLLFTGILWAALLIPVPADGIPGRFDHMLPRGIDKLVHGVLFALESYFLHRFLRHRIGSLDTRSARWRLVGWTGVSAFTMAGLTELCQAAIPGRSADLWDLVADGLGIMVWWLWDSQRVSKPGSG